MAALGLDAFSDFIPERSEFFLKKLTDLECKIPFGQALRHNSLNFDGCSGVLGVLHSLSDGPLLRLDAFELESYMPDLILNLCPLGT